MTKRVPNIDASVLGFTPKGAFYNPAEMQMQKMDELWARFFKFDRIIFSLSTILPGTAYSKGRMAHMLLSNPVPQSKALVRYGLDDSFEDRIIMYNLQNESIPRSLKSLLMLTGIKNKKTKEVLLPSVNNARTRRIILEFIFNRSNKSLDELAVKYKVKLRRLIRHALGKYIIHKLLNGDMKVFHKYIGIYNPSAYLAILHIFGKDIGDGKLMFTSFFPKMNHYCTLRDLAKSQKSDRFIEGAKEAHLPPEVLMGFRNYFKLPIEKKAIYERSQMSERQKLQTEAAIKKAGGKVKVNYEKQDIYDLWKALYFKLFNKDDDNFNSIVDAIELLSQDKSHIDFGKTVIIFDCSHSMYGSDKRHLHPFLTGMSIISKLDNVQTVIFAGGTYIKTPSEKWPKVIIPIGVTNLWKPLIEAAKQEPETIMVISDGYENAVKGLFAVVHKHLKDIGYKYNLVHVNPVFAAEMSGARKLVPDEPILAISDYKYLETNFIFGMLQTHSEQIKNILVEKYKTMVLKEASDVKEIKASI